MPEKKHFTPEQIEELKNRPIDLSDIPEITDFSGFYMRNCKPRKQVITISIDSDVLELFRRSGRGYQTRINDALKEFVMEHPDRF